jgi:hypothetical protein
LADLARSSPSDGAREFRKAAIVLAGFALLLYGPSLLGRSLVGGADVVRSAYPIRHHFWSIVRRGELPTWSPYLMGGYPIIVEEQASPYYPTEWLFGLLPSPAAYNLAVGLHVWFSALGMYVLARKLQLTKNAAWMVAIIAALGAPLSARVAAGHPSFLFGRSLMPWILVALLQLARNPGWWPALGMASVFGGQLLIGIGNYQTALYTAVLATVFGIFIFAFNLRAIRRRRFIAWGVTGLVIAIGLGAARLGPTLQIGLQSTRQTGLSTEGLNAGSLPSIMLAGYILPHTFDDPSITDYAWPEFALYVGSAPALLAVYAAIKRRREPAVLFWSACTVMFLLLSLGDQGGLFPLFTRYVPGYQFFRTPARHGMVASLGVAMLAGYGLDALGSARMEHSRTDNRSRLAVWLGLMAVGLVLIAAIATYREADGPALAILPERLFRGAIWFAAAVALFFIAYRCYRIRPRPILATLQLGVVALDLALYAIPQIYQRSVPADLPYVNPDNFGERDAYSVAFLESGSSADWGLVNVAADNGVRLVNMYTGVVPQRMAGLVNLIAGRPAVAQHEQNQILLNRISRPDLLDIMNVQYLLVSVNQRVDGDSSLQHREIFDGVNSYENLDALPFAFVVPQTIAVDTPGAALDFVAHTDILTPEIAAVEGTLPEKSIGCPEVEAELERVSHLRLEGGNIRFKITTTNPGMLTVNQTYQQGWSGWVDGEPTRIYPVNYRWMGVYLHCPGTFQVHLRFLPASVSVGLAVTACTLLLALGVSIVVKRRADQRAVSH